MIVRAPVVRGAIAIARACLVDVPEERRLRFTGGTGSGKFVAETAMRVLEPLRQRRRARERVGPIQKQRSHRLRRLEIASALRARRRPASSSVVW